MTAPLFVGSDWSPKLLAQVTDEISRICDEELHLDCFPMHICTITAEQMLDAYAMGGMPTNYAHWSYGKRFLWNRRQYERGQMGLAYEIVINTNPCLVYCMEENSMTMQTLVIAHAGFGHNHFFKNNHLFKQWTDPSSIVDYLKFSRDLVAEYEEEHGVAEVQDFLSACHAWSRYGIDRYKRPHPLSAREEKERMRLRAAQVEENLNVIWRIIPPAPNAPNKDQKEEDKVFPSEPQENILYFIEKNAPSLPSWKRELIRIVRKEAQYFYPQMLTKVMNEGFACFTHHYVMTRLWEKGLITESAYQEFLVGHTGVIFQPGFDERRKVLRGYDKDGKPIVEEVSIYRGINPYALGFAMFTDIRRMCERPTEEDRKWFPHLAGTPWLSGVKWAAENFTDKTFIEQYLSPKLIRDFKLFAIRDDDADDEIVVSAIHDDDGYRDVRNVLASMYDLNTDLPAIQVVSVDRRGARTLSLKHDVHQRKYLNAEDTEASLLLLRQLWEYPVALSSVDEDGNVLERWECVDGEEVEYHADTAN